MKHNPPLVLIADDEYHTTAMLQHLFERDGFQVAIAADGVIALDMAQKLLPDLILLDINMPRMSGFDVLRLLRENAATAAIPTIIVTAKAREATDVAHGLTLGADDYVYKPFDPGELLARSRSKIKARQLEENLHRRTQELEALLRVSEELGQYLEVGELLDLVLYLALDLLPANAAIICEMDEQGQVRANRVHKRPSLRLEINFDRFLTKFLAYNTEMRWPDAPPLLKEFKSGMIVPLQHGDSTIGVLALLSENATFDDNHMRLFKGIGRQAALALRNAQLYEVQADYAQHLEEMVEQRTEALKSTQQMLVRSEKLASIGHLAASIAHEINNPLQPIRIHLEHMLEDIENNDPIDAMAVESIQQSVERISRIVSQLLEFAGKRSSGPDLQEIDIKRTLEGVIQLNHKYFEHERLKIVTDLPPLPTIYGSKDQLEQVFMNLTLNAKAAMKSGGKLQISARQQDNDIIIQFSDNGSGISEELINNIFDPFFSTKPNGTGLGLFVSYGIIQNHHGSIEVESQLNKGTTFTIKLPISHSHNG
jgi:signal transduction histidine kinase